MIMKFRLRALRIESPERISDIITTVSGNDGRLKVMLISTHLKRLRIMTPKEFLYKRNTLKRSGMIPLEPLNEVSGQSQKMVSLNGYLSEIPQGDMIGNDTL
jgi:hypothetical protein